MSVVAVAAGTVLLAGCGGGSASGGAAAAPPSGAPSVTSTPSIAASAAAQSNSGHPVSDASIRVVNLYAPKGKPGPALDIYDTQLTGAAATPILTNVTFGTASSYVHPRLLSTFGQKTVELFALPAGENPATPTANDDSKGVGGLIDDGSNARITIVLSADTGSVQIPGPLSGLSTSERVESGDDGQGAKGPAAPPPPAGKAEILVDQSLVPQTGHSGIYLLIDHSCAPPLNGDPQIKGLPYIFNAATSAIQSAFAIFPTTAGTHQVSVVSWPSAVTPTCKQLVKGQSPMSVTLAAGQQSLLFVYGSSLTALHLLAVPIQPSAA
jgi:hypothetical protein